MQFSYLKYIIQWILVYPSSWVNITTVNFRTFSSPPKSSILFRSHISSLPSSSTLDTTIPFTLKKKIYLFLTVLHLCCYVRAFSSCGDWGLLSGCDAWTSHCGGFSCYAAWAVGCAGFSSCGTWS